MKKHSARVAPLSACNSPVLTLTKVEGRKSFPIRPRHRATTAHNIRKRAAATCLIVVACFCFFPLLSKGCTRISLIACAKFKGGGRHEPRDSTGARNFTPLTQHPRKNSAVHGVLRPRDSSRGAFACSRTGDFNYYRRIDPPPPPPPSLGD